MRYFATYEELKKYSTMPEAYRAEKAMKARSFYDATTFLSHSSKDHEFLLGIIFILENHGAKVYVDEKDPELINFDISKTAERLRSVVKSCRKFVLFVTEQTKDSKWIPWELGLGDGKLCEDNVALFPAAEKAYEQSWSEVEYLGLYKRILWGNFEGQQPEWIVHDRITNFGIPLRRWLAGY